MLHRRPPSLAALGVSFALAMLAVGCGRAPAKGPVRGTIARGETLEGPCGLRVTFEGVGHTMDPGGHEGFIGFTTALGDQSRAAPLFAKDAGKVQEAFGHRWLVVTAEGFDPKSALVEVCSEAKPQSATLDQAHIAGLLVDPFDLYLQVAGVLVDPFDLYLQVARVLVDPFDLYLQVAWVLVDPSDLDS